MRRRRSRGHEAPALGRQRARDRGALRARAPLCARGRRALAAARSGPLEGVGQAGAQGGGRGGAGWRPGQGPARPRGRAHVLERLAGHRLVEALEDVGGVTARRGPQPERHERLEGGGALLAVEAVHAHGLGAGLRSGGGVGGRLERGAGGRTAACTRRERSGREGRTAAWAAALWQADGRRGADASREWEGGCAPSSHVPPWPRPQPGACQTESCTQPAPARAPATPTCAFSLSGGSPDSNARRRAAAAASAAAPAPPRPRFAAAPSARS
jgi:hypothetical protein